MKGRGQRYAPAIAALVMVVLGAAAPAQAESLSPWFHLASVSRPGNLTGKEGEIAVTAINVGDGSVSTSVPVVLSDVLPEHLRARFVKEGDIVQGSKTNLVLEENPTTKRKECEVSESRTITCTFDAGSLPPFSQVEILIGVAVEAGAATGELNQLSISGGGAPSSEIARPITVSSEPTPFGVEDYEPLLEEAGGSADSQAGSHPFQFTTTLNLNARLTPDASHGGELVPAPAALPKEVIVKLPPGLVGDPTAYARCTLAQFGAVVGEGNACPADTILGAATVTFYEEKTSEAGGTQTRVDPIFNLEPGPGEAARFGFATIHVPTFLGASVRTGEDYGVTIHVDDIPQDIGFLNNTVTFWGVPGAASHNDARGAGCLEQAEGFPLPGPCEAEHESSPPPFLTLPTSCSGEPLQNTVEVSSWLHPSNLVSPQPDPTAPGPLIDGCGLLPFHAEIRDSPDGQAASTPTGVTVDVHVPQEGQLDAEGLAQSNIKNITVTLPEGVALNPSAADGLQACSPSEAGFEGENPETHTLRFTDEEVSCPNASKIASVTVRTPLLPNLLRGFVYLAAPQNFAFPANPLENPFGSLVAMYLIVKDPVSGTLIKLPGSVSLSPSGQITSTFADNPQLPFEDAELEFFGGERAPLTTPARCGSYTTTASFEPWSGTPGDEEVLHSSSTFDITTGPNGGPCPGATLPFTPSLVSETSNIDAGAFTPLDTTISREDGQQSIQSVILHYPPGVSGMLTGVPLCPEAQANAGTCGPESLIGETIVSVGVGGDPFTVTGGKVYLTESYQGAPFGLSIVNPAKAGPFDLQEGRPVIVRAKIEINPTTAALTITTGQIPQIIDGFPLQIKHVYVTVSRPGFTFNPTNCTPMGITGTIGGWEGASFPVSTPFQVTNCALLKFAPKFSASVPGKSSKADGETLHVRLAFPTSAQGTEANIRYVKVDLPKQLPSELRTLQQACLAKVFEEDPANCPEHSIVGHATAVTPILPVPLSGPAYFVSYGGAKFPELVMVLQGYGVTIYLHGETFISKAGITSSTFSTVPDQPVTSFELTLPAQPYSALGPNLPNTANYSFCGQKMVMPTHFIAQNGAELKQETPIAVTGCPQSLSVRTSSVHARSLTIIVYVPAAGKLALSGKGVTSSKRVARGQELVTLTLTQKHSGRLRTDVKLSYVPAKGHKQSKTLKASFRR